jgi:hypothetical protein
MAYREKSMMLASVILFSQAENANSVGTASLNATTVSNLDKIPEETTGVVVMEVAVVVGRRVV